MKIAMIGHKRIPSREGGVEIVVEALSRRMVQRGHQVTVYNRKSHHVAGTAFDDHSHLHNLDGVQIRWVPTPNSKKLNAIVYSFFATVQALFGGYDIIHFHAEGPAAMVPLAKCFGKKMRGHHSWLGLAASQVGRLCHPLSPLWRAYGRQVCRRDHRAVCQYAAVFC